MNKEMEKLYRAQLRAEECENAKNFPSGIVYENGSKESYFSASKKKSKKIS